MEDIAQRGLDTAVAGGAEYAESRYVEIEREIIVFKNGEPSSIETFEEAGVGVRVLIDGCWGFSSTAVFDPESVDDAAGEALANARAAGLVRSRSVVLTPEPAYRDDWRTPVARDAFDVSLEEKLDLLARLDGELRREPEVRVAEGFLDFKKERQIFLSSEGDDIHQLLVRSGGGCQVFAIRGDEVQRRSYPNSFRGQYASKGYELIEELDLVGNASRVSSEAVQLLGADPCPVEEMDLVLGGSQIGLQIHESVGHPTELDRILGHEANFAGRSFVKPSDLGTLRYGSPLVNIVGDCTLPGGLATFGYDDDGVRAQRWHVVKDGVLSGFLTSRDTAADIGLARSTGCCRADGWNNFPMVRMPNLSLMPGNWDFDDLIADTGNGIFMDTNKSWSIDQMRLNFQFATEVAWEIKNGKLGRMFKNPTYQGMTTGFWGSCDAICGEEDWIAWGLHTCGKGEPNQVAEMSHGAAPARFRNVKVGLR